MALPKAELGLVVHYGFAWAGADRRPPPDAGKDRPCLIVDIRDVEEGGRTLRRVTYLPISHTPPRADEHALPIGARLAAHLGLTVEPSYLYTPYACEDDWPLDLAKVPGTDRFDYGFIPPALFRLVTEQFRKALETREIYRR